MPISSGTKLQRAVSFNVHHSQVNVRMHLKYLQRPRVPGAWHSTVLQFVQEEQRLMP